MNKPIGCVLELFISKEDTSTRISKRVIEVDNNGIVGDKFYAKDMDRSILLTSRESYELASKHSIHMSYGALGENILIDYNPYALGKSSQLKIGNVILEVTQACTICNHLSVIDKKLPNLLQKDRGVFVKVIEGGCIKKNDKVYVFVVK